MPTAETELRGIGGGQTLADRFLARLGDVLGDDHPEDEDPPEIEISSPAKLFTYHQAHPLAIEALLSDKFGLSWYGWQPETLRDEIVYEWPRAKLSDVNWAKIQALRTLGANKSFWTMWEVFAPVAVALNNRLPSPSVLVAPSVAQIYVAVDIAAAFDTRFPYGDELSRFIAARFIDEGLNWAVEPLGFIQHLVQQPVYKCEACGNIDDDENNTCCDRCFSHDITKFYRAPFSDARRQVVDEIIAGRQEIPETREGVVGARLKVAVDYVRYRQLQLRAQLHMLERRHRDARSR